MFSWPQRVLEAYTFALASGWCHLTCKIPRQVSIQPLLGLEAQPGLRDSHCSYHSLILFSVFSVLMDFYKGIKLALLDECVIPGLAASHGGY